MAFTTTTGAGGTSLIGTSGVDVTTVTGSIFPLYVGAQAANDAVNFEGTTTAATVEMGKGVDTLNVEAVSASTMRGNDGNDIITLTGAISSSALINGNAGADAITVGSTLNAARVLGGADNDTILVNGALSNGAIVNGNDGKDTITVNAGVSGSTVYGGKGSDFLIAAGASGAILSGDIGADTVVGGTGADTLYGGNGNDLISSVTTVSTTAGIDSATDILSGGEGVDTFMNAGNRAASTAAGASATSLSAGYTVQGADVITDFTAGAGGDIIDLETLTLTSGLKASVGTELTTGTYYAFTGTYSSSTGVFTVTAETSGTSTLIAKAVVAGGSANIDRSGNLVVLDGVLATQLAVGNFV